MKSKNIEKKFNNKILNKSTRYLLAVSGGPDSIFMMLMMKKNGYDFSVAHVNYGIREESDKEQEYLSYYCRNNNIFFFSSHADKFKNKGNFQSQARIFRYNFFCKVMEKESIKFLLIAHQADDLIETYIFQKERNGLNNFWGIKEISYYNSIIIIRPILGIFKNEIIKYLDDKNFTYFLDSSNTSSKYTRNRIRKELSNILLKTKKDILREIILKNKIIELTEIEKSKFSNLFIFDNFIILNSEWHKLNIEVQLRVIFDWINTYTHNLFVSNKKSIFKELRKQLNSTKKFITMFLNKNYLIKKENLKAYILKI